MKKEPVFHVEHLNLFYEGSLQGIRHGIRT